MPSKTQKYSVAHARGATLLRKPDEDGMLAVIHCYERDGFDIDPAYALFIWVSLARDEQKIMTDNERAHALINAN